ncbi:MAG: hypothetical protein ACOCXJ_03725 [Planctomycetota bacterium]
MRTQTTHRCPGLRRLGLGLGVMLLLGACSPRDQEALRRDTIEALRQNDLQLAAQATDELYECALGPDGVPVRFNDKHGMLWRMQRGLLDHLAGDWYASLAHLTHAAELVDTHRSAVFSRAVASMVANETVKPYDGRGFEHIQVDYYRSLDAVLLAQRGLGLYRPPSGDLLCLPSRPVPADGDPQQAKTVDANGPADAPAQESAEADSRPGPEADPAAAISPLEWYDRAISFARRMVLTELQRTVDLSDRDWLREYRYADDPFARVLAACLILATPERAAGDLQFAQAMLLQARRAYREQHGLFAGDEHFRYEVPAVLELVDRLLARVMSVYDPERYAQEFDQDDGQRLLVPEGHGSLLIVDHVGLVTRPHVLDVRLRTGLAILAGLFSLSEEERARGITITQITLGPFQVAAKGPGSEIIDTWSAQLLTPAILAATDFFTAVFGFAMPVHPQDRPIPPPARVLVDGGPARALQVVSDIDAYARATLKDAQPRLVTRILARTVVKQAAVAAAAEEVRKQHGAGWAALTQFVGSTGMTWSEVADLRAWFLLPDHITATVIDVPAGRHRIRLEGPAGSCDLGSVSVPAGGLVVVPLRSMPEGTDS